MSGIESKDDNSRSVCYVCEKGFPATGWDTCPKCIALIEDSAGEKLTELSSEVITLRARVAELEGEIYAGQRAQFQLIGKSKAALEEVARLDAGWHKANGDALEAKLALREDVARLRALLERIHGVRALCHPDGLVGVLGADLARELREEVERATS